MSGKNEVKVLIARNKKKKSSGFVVEESDDGRFYFTKIPSDCRQVSVGDQVREINGIRWLDIEDEEHANEILDDPAVEYIALSVIPKPDNLPVNDEDDDDVDEAEDEDDSVVSGGDSDSEDVSIATDVEDEYDQDNKVVRKSASTRPSQLRKSAQQRPSNASDIHVSDASDDDDADVARYNYAQEAARRESDRQARRSTTTSHKDSNNNNNSNNNGYGQKGRVSDVKQKAREFINTRDSSNDEKLDPAKEAERERARAIKQRREQEKLEAAAERRRKDELAEQLKDAEAHGKKIQRAKVTVERNIGAYSLGSPATSKKSTTSTTSTTPKKPSSSASTTPKKPSSSTSTPKKPSSSSSNSGGGSSKVTTAPRPSSGGWNKVSISNKK